MRALTDIDLLRELEPAVAASLNRHLTVAQEWFPHEFIPWNRGHDFAGEQGQPWSEEQSALTDAAKAAFEVNLLTEDNLPSYHHELSERFGRDGAWNTWVRRWTAEEGRHATAIRDYLLVSRAVDPVALERARMATVQAGWTSQGKDVLRSLAYVTFQELATRIAHRNTGRIANDRVADQLLARVAADENLHMVFYRDVVAAALAIAPEQTMVAIAAELVDFKMPGAGIPGFLRKSMQIADAGIYDVRLHREEVVLPTLRHWGVLEMPASDAGARRAQEQIAHYLEALDQMVRRYEARRAQRQERSSR